MARKPPTVDASLGKQVRRAKGEALDHEATQPKIAEVAFRTGASIALGEAHVKVPVSGDRADF